MMMVTFGSISALFGLTNHIIDQAQYTILLTGVIGSAVVPTLIAQIWFRPHFGLWTADADDWLHQIKRAQIVGRAMTRLE